MKKLTLFLMFTSLNASAVTWEVQNPCTGEPEFEGSFHVKELPQSVGKISLNIFENNQIPYLGTDAGLNSILNTPTGSDAIEVLSETKMRAYGWCYEVNGFQPGATTDNFFFESNNDHLFWYFGYALYDSGKWLTYCEPSYEVKPDFLCD